MELGLFVSKRLCTAIELRGLDAWEQHGDGGFGHGERRSACFALLACLPTKDDNREMIVTALTLYAAGYQTEIQGTIRSHDGFRISTGAESGTETRETLGTPA